MKRIMIPVLISSFLLGSFPIAFADNSIKIQDNGEYLCFDISEKANCIGFVTTGVKQDGVLYEVPNFIGVGRTSASDGVQDIHNKTAFDKKKDDDGYIYSDNGLPFYVNTVENNKNTILLGKGQYLNNTEFSIDLSDEKLYSISFLSDVTYNVDANSFSITVEYSDGTTVTDNGWVIYPRNNDKQALLNYNGVDSAISFDYNAADAENTALIYRLTASNPQQPLSVSYSLPVYTLKLDSSKKAKKVTVKQLGEYYGMEIFAMTAKRYTYADEILELIDALPQSDEIQYGNYENYKDSVEKIKQAIADGVKLDDERKAKALQIIAKIEEFESNPILFINYTIDNLPQAENITIENYSEYLQSIQDCHKTIRRFGK